jgi:hypothetical protein
MRIVALTPGEEITQILLATRPFLRELSTRQETVACSRDIACFERGFLHSAAAASS